MAEPTLEQVAEAIRGTTSYRRRAAAVLALYRPALAEAWDAGRAAERRDWELTYDLVTPDEDRQPIPNPYRTEETPHGGQ